MCILFFLFFSFESLPNVYFLNYVRVYNDVKLGDVSYFKMDIWCIDKPIKIHVKCMPAAQKEVRTMTVTLLTPSSASSCSRTPWVRLVQLASLLRRDDTIGVLSISSCRETERNEIKHAHLLYTLCTVQPHQQVHILIGMRIQNHDA